jgi:hypothetical protein
MGFRAGSPWETSQDEVVAADRKRRNAVQDGLVKAAIAHCGTHGGRRNGAVSLRAPHEP